LWSKITAFWNIDRTIKSTWWEYEDGINLTLFQSFSGKNLCFSLLIFLQDFRKYWVKHILRETDYKPSLLYVSYCQIYVSYCQIYVSYCKYTSATVKYTSATVKNVFLNGLMLSGTQTNQLTNIQERKVAFINALIAVNL